MKGTILLTGATGFLGSHLLEALLENDYPTVILKRSFSDTWRISHLINHVISYDVDKVALEKPFSDQRIDTVIHTACHYGRNAGLLSKVVGTNLMFGIRVLEQSLIFHTNTFINTDTFFNTDTMLQKYLNVYTLSKKQFVEWLIQRSNEIQVVNFKIEHMYGPKDDTNKFVPWVVSQLKAEIPEIKLTKGEQKRDFIYIDDVVSAYMTILDNLPRLSRFSEFDVGTGKLVTLKNFLEALKDIFESTYGKSKSVMNFGALPYREGELMTVDVDISALQNIGWSPKNFHYEGLKKMFMHKK